MITLRNRTARGGALSGVTLSGIALAFGLFASASSAAVGAPWGQPEAPGATEASVQCDAAPERCDTNREAREMGFGRRGGDK